MTIRLLIADDHSIVRRGLKQLFTFDPDIEVAGEANNCIKIFELLRHEVFDVLLMDLTMPGISGIDLINRIHLHHPDQRILVFTMHNEPQVVARVLRAGAEGFITKDSDPEKLLAAIHKVASGGRYIEPELAEEVALFAITPEHSSLHAQLSDREYQIFLLLASGLGVNEIASQLAISNKTVSTHKQRIMTKLHFSSITELVRYALEANLI